MKKKTILILCAALAVLVIAGVVLAVVLSGGDEGGGFSKARASGMWLVKAEGEVSVTDGDGEDVPVKALPGMDLRLTLRSGYSVGTGIASFGWVDLDDEKIAKLDESSLAEIRKSGRELEIEVSAGALYFNVKKPLRDDETMEIRSSSMVMAIRGTSGWVRAIDDETFDVYIIDGTVQCTVEGETASVTAGEHARMSVEGEEPTITVEPFREEDIPAFVLEEAQEDEDLREELADIGVTVQPGAPDDPDGPDTPDDPDGPDGPNNPNDPGGPNDPDGPDAPSGPDEGEQITWRIETVRPELRHTLPQVFYRKPVFSGSAAGVAALNEYFDREAQAFTERFAGTDDYLDSPDGPDAATYTDKVTTTVTEPIPGIVRVEQQSEQGNSKATHPGYGSSSVLFDCATGAKLGLLDLVDGTEEEVRAEILRQLEASPDAGYFDYDFFLTKSLDSLYFTPEGGEVRLGISYSDLGVGAAGSMSASVRLPLKQRYRDAMGGVFTKSMEAPSTGQISYIRTYRDSEEVGGWYSLFYEYPEFGGAAPGVPVINQFFKDRAAEFVVSEDYLCIQALARESQSYVACYLAPNFGVLNGGVNDLFTCVDMWGELTDDQGFHSYERSYVFWSQTGQLASLRDFVEGSDDQIRAFLAKALREKADLEDAARAVAGLDLDRLMFKIDDGAVTVLILPEELGLEGVEVIQIPIPGVLY